MGDPGPVRVVQATGMGKLSGEPEHRPRCSAPIRKGYNTYVALIGLIFTVLGGLAGCGSFWYAYTADNRARKEERRTKPVVPGHARVRRLSGWSRINIVVSVTAVCVFALGIFLITQSGNSSPQPPIAGTTASPSTSTAKPSPTNTERSSSPSSSSPSGSWSEQFGPKPLLITDGDIVDLDQVPPNVNAGGPVIFQFSNNQFYDYDALVKWTGTEPGTASAAACSDLISEQGAQYAKPVMQDTYCAKLTF